jgi:hypothetical protein
MTLRVPDTQLTKPNTVALTAGTELFRVHLSQFAGNSFNPCKGNPTRFAPISDEHRACIPSLYAASSLKAAVFETIFHDVDARDPIKVVPRKNVRRVSQATLTTTRELNIVSMRQPDLKAWRIKRNELIGCSPKHYSQTAAWAAAIHDQFSDADGILWTSNQCDPDTAYLFYGSRVTDTDFNVTQTRDGATDPTFLIDVETFGLSAGIDITI